MGTRKSRQPRVRRRVAKTIRVTVEQDQLIRKRARLWGVSQSEVIRCAIQGVNLPLGNEAKRRKALQELRKSMEERAKIEVPQTGRTWTRDDLYEERLNRIVRR